MIVFNFLNSYKFKANALFFFLTLLFSRALVAEEMFYQASILQDALQGIVDFSWLNHPLKESDKVIVKNSRFYIIGKDLKANTEDDVPLRLFGVNLAFEANFPTEDDAKRIAKRFARLGVNLVRLHHMDSNPDIDPHDAKSILLSGPFPSINMQSIARLRFFIDELKKNGIYIDLNLHVGYRFRPSVDNVPNTLGEMPRQSKPLHMISPVMIRLQQEYAKKIINLLNLRDDPVLAIVEINNESSLVHAWQTGLLEKVLDGDYKKQFFSRFSEFLEKTSNDRNNMNFESRAESALKEGGDDLIRFLVEEDYRYLSILKSTIRDAVGPDVPITGTQMNFGGVINSISHRDMDYFDVHFYVDHYNFSDESKGGGDWSIVNASAVSKDFFPIFLNSVFLRPANKPFTVSEFNQPWPNEYGAEIVPLTAILGSFQGWDGLFFYAYSHRRDWDKKIPSGFNLIGDVGKLVNFGQAAWLYRTGAISGAQKTILLRYNENLMKKLTLRRASGWKIYEVLRGINLQPELGLLHRVVFKSDSGDTDGGVVDGSIAFSDRNLIKADTGEFSYNKNKERFVLNSPHGVGVFGRILSADSVETDKIIVQAEDSRTADSVGKYFALLITPADGNVLSNSKRFLVTIPGAVKRSKLGGNIEKLVGYRGDMGKWTLEPTQEGKRSGGLQDGLPPVMMARMECKLLLRNERRPVAVFPLDDKGGRLMSLSQDDVKQTPDGVQIHLQSNSQVLAPWYEIVIGD